VEVLVSDVQLRQGLWEEHLRAMPDLARLARKLQRGKGTLQDCVRIYQAVQQLPKLTATLEEYSGPHSSLISAMFVSPLTVSGHKVHCSLLIVNWTMCMHVSPVIWSCS